MPKKRIKENRPRTLNTSEKMATMIIVRYIYMLLPSNES